MSDQLLVKGIEERLRMYPAVEREGIVDSLRDELVQLIETFIEEARDDGWSDGWSDGYFEAGGLNG